jgi:mono/diheme cytochrome c family protein
MIKYFLFSLVLVSVLVVGIFGFRGQKFVKRPLEIFPDMDVQDKVMAQEPSSFFSDGLGARKPVAGSVVHSSDGGLFPVEFGEGRDGYYYTGTIGDYYANGLPEELGLTADNMTAFLRRGHGRYTISCQPCHGASGDGKGITSYYGIPGIANLHLFPRSDYPDGRIYSVITEGKGQMGAYKSTLPVRDRWAIVAYLRALQTAQKTPVATTDAEAATPATN